MTTTVIRVDPTHPDPAALAPAAQCLARGGLVAFPTETVYGLGAHALDPEAVMRLFAAKARPANDPVIVHLATLKDVVALVSWLPSVVTALAERFWPGPLTLVLPKSAAVPVQVTAGLDAVAVRIPAHPVAQALIRLAGVPVAAPSANLFSRPSPTLAAHVLEDLDGRIDLLVDGGATRVGVESTVLDLAHGVPTVLRWGAVSLEELRRVLPDARAGVNHARPASETAPQPAPGMLAKHYSPRTPLVLYEGAPDAVMRRLATDVEFEVSAGRRVGVVVADEDTVRAAPAGVRLVRLGPGHDSGAVAHELFAALRGLDIAGVDVIMVRGFPATDALGLAIQDRLRRAAVRIVTCEHDLTSP